MYCVVCKTHKATLVSFTIVIIIVTIKIITISLLCIMPASINDVYIYMQVSV